MGFLSKLFNYNNVGKKIKGMASVIFGVGSFVAVFGSLAWEAAMVNAGGPLWWLPIVTFFGGPFLAWIVSWFLHAYGECAEACDSRLRVAEEKAPKGVGGLLKYNCLGGKIRLISKVGFILGAAVSIVSAIIWEVQIVDSGVGVWWYPPILLIAGPFLSWVASWPLYVYGDINDAAVLRNAEDVQNPFKAFGHWNRFDNVGNKIRCTAIIARVVLAVAALIGTIVWFVLLLIAKSKLWWLPFVMLVVTALAAVIGSWMLYAYGNIVAAASMKVAEAEEDEPFMLSDLIREKKSGRKIKGLALTFVLLTLVVAVVSFVISVVMYVKAGTDWWWLMIPTFVAEVVLIVTCGWQLYGLGEIVHASSIKLNECGDDGRILHRGKEKDAMAKSGLMDIFNYDNVGKKIKWMSVVLFVISIVAIVVFIAVDVAMALTTYMANWNPLMLCMTVVFTLLYSWISCMMLYAIGEVAEASSTMLCDVPVETKVRADGHVYCGKCWKEIGEETEKCSCCGSVL